jgi:hypothetical protein
LDFSVVPFFVVGIAVGFVLEDIRARRKKKEPLTRTLMEHIILLAFSGLAAWPIIIGLAFVLIPCFAFWSLRATVIQVATHRNITVSGSIIEGLALGWLMQKPILGIVASVALVVLHWSLRDWAERFKTEHWKSTPAPTAA